LLYFIEMEENPIIRQRTIETTPVVEENFDIKKYVELIKNVGGFSVSETFLEVHRNELRESSEFQGILQQEMINAISYGNLDSFTKLTSLNLHAPETIESLQPALQERMIKLLTDGDMISFIKVLSGNFHTPETFQSIQPALKERMRTYLSPKYSTRDLKYIADFVEKFRSLNLDIPEPFQTIQSILQKEMIQLLFDPDEVKWAGILSLNLHTPETLQVIQSALQQRIIDVISYVDDRNIDTLIKLLDLNLHTPETIQAIQPAFQERVIKLLKDNDEYTLIKLLDLNLHTPETIEALQSAFQERMAKALSEEDVYLFTKFLFLNPPITPETIQAIQPALQQGMNIALSKGDISSFDKLLALNLHTLETLQAIPQSVLQEGMMGFLYNLDDQKVDFLIKLLALNLHTPETIEAIQPALQYGVIDAIGPHRSELTALTKLLALNLHTPETIEAIQPALQERVRYIITDDYTRSYNSNRITLTKLLALNLHTPETFQVILQYLTIDRLIYGVNNSNTELLNFNALDISVQEIPHLQPALQERMAVLISVGDIDSFTKLISLNLHTPETYSGIVKHFEPTVSLIEHYIPSFREKVNTSVKVLISVATLAKVPQEEIKMTFEQNPFLAEALDHEYGARLITSFVKFDTSSQENIKAIFTEQSEAPCDSVEYRVSIQERLKGYGRNNEILEVIEQKGINTDAWLNWDKEIIFDLGKAEQKATALLLENPIKRTQESFFAIFSEFNGILKEYKQDLIQTRIPEDTTPLQEQLAKMEQELVLAQTSGDTKKETGITKGMVSLRSRIESPKMISAMDTIKGLEAQITRLLADITQAQKVLKEAETLPVTDAKSRIEKKQLTKDTESKIKELTKKLALRYKNLFAQMGEVLEKTKGKEWATNIIQQERTAVGEALSHIDIDCREFERIFTSEEKTTSRDGRSMRIRLASRAPQDLYIGNYTNCCVAIDNGHHGAESPISDYLTDLGMQIVIIEDEEAGIPVAAAWLFLGTDGNEQALVIDNIEGNTSYTTAYTTQLQDKLRVYLAEYAQSLSVGLSQGALIAQSRT
jgi:hypothetical protein